MTTYYKTVFEQIGCRETTIEIKKNEAGGDVDIKTIYISNPYIDIPPVATTWERSENLKKDA